MLCIIVFCFLMFNGCAKKLNTLQLTTVPTDANVTANGKYYGTSPVSIPQEYDGMMGQKGDPVEITIEKAGYYPTVRTVYPEGNVFRFFERDYLDGSKFGKGNTFPVEIYLKPDESTAEWKTAKLSNNLETLENFLKEHPDTTFYPEARELIKPLAVSREKNELERIQAMIDSSELDKVPVTDIAKYDNLLLKKGTYNRKTVYFKKEGSSKSERVTTRKYKLVKLHDLPNNTENIISWKDNARINTGILYLEDSSIVLIVPRKVLPCELEFPDVLYNRVVVR